nr:MAG TPA: hypothetical protein [Caudoviricetes sp.]
MNKSEWVGSYDATYLYNFILKGNIRWNSQI